MRYYKIGGKKVQWEKKKGKEGYDFLHGMAVQAMLRTLIMKYLTILHIISPEISLPSSRWQSSSFAQWLSLEA